MEILEFVLQVLLGITSLLLTLLILLHKGRGGGLSDMFGGGMTSALGSSGLAERNLNRFTVDPRAGVVRLDRGARPHHQVPGRSDGTGGNAIRGTRVGAGPMGEQDHGFHAERIAISYWDALGNETVRYFAAGHPRRGDPRDDRLARTPVCPPGATRRTRLRWPRPSRTRRTSRT